MSEQLPQNKNLTENTDELDAQVPEYVDLDMSAPDVNATFDAYKSQIGQDERVSAMASMGENMQGGAGRHRRKYDATADARRNLQTATGISLDQPRHKMQFHLAAHYQGEGTSAAEPENLLDKSGAELREMKLSKEDFRAGARLPEGWTREVQAGRLRLIDSEGVVRQELSDSLTNSAEAAATRQVTAKARAAESKQRSDENAAPETSVSGMTTPGALPEKAPAGAAPTSRPKAKKATASSKPPEKASTESNGPRHARPKGRKGPEPQPATSIPEAPATPAPETATPAPAAPERTGRRAASRRAPASRGRRPANSEGTLAPAFGLIGERPDEPDNTELPDSPLATDSAGQTFGMPGPDVPRRPRIPENFGATNAGDPLAALHAAPEAPIPAPTGATPGANIFFVPTSAAHEDDLMRDFGPTRDDGRSVEAYADDALALVGAPAAANAAPVSTALPEGDDDYGESWYADYYGHEPASALEWWDRNSSPATTTNPAPVVPARPVPATTQRPGIPRPGHYEVTLPGVEAKMQIGTNYGPGIPEAPARAPLDEAMNQLGSRFASGPSENDPNILIIEDKKTSEEIAVDLALAESDPAYNAQILEQVRAFSERQLGRRQRAARAIGRYATRRMGRIQDRLDARRAAIENGENVPVDMSVHSDAYNGDYTRLDARNAETAARRQAQPNFFRRHRKATLGTLAGLAFVDVVAGGVAVNKIMHEGDHHDTAPSVSAGPTAGASHGSNTPLSAKPSTKPSSPSTASPRHQQPPETGNGGGQSGSRVESHAHEDLTFSVDGKRVSAKLKPGGTIIEAGHDAGLTDTQVLNAVEKAGITQSQAASLQPGQVVDFTQAGGGSYTVHLQ